MSEGVSFWFKQRVESICTMLEKNILSNKSLKCQVVFGPVRSRRLGSVLGINNLKSKICSYNCIYCPSGETSCCSVCSTNCLSPYELHLSVRNKLNELKKRGKEIDYILFAGSGAPTLDLNLSSEILLLREFGYKIAVFTNSSLLWNDNIQQNLMNADYVSLKIDTANEETWLKLNRPHRRLNYNTILDGIKRFSDKFDGVLTTETMLIKNINDNINEIEQLSQFLNTLKYDQSYFMTPRYPPAESYAEHPDAETLQQLSQVIKSKIKNSTLLCCPETEEFFATDDFENELLGLLALHPVRVDAVNYYLKDKENALALRSLLENHSIKQILFNGEKFYAIDNDYHTADGRLPI
jgi:wyosine [tRNA(Phe)-imidazoG37] synthetase (radical SAM superfamily)